MNYFVIDAKLPSMNEYVRSCRANKYRGAEFKRSIEALIGYSITRGISKGMLKPIDKPCEIHIYWHEATQRRDVDNIQSAQKFILDALQHHKIIKNDNRKWVKQIYHTVIDDEKDFVIVDIREVKNDKDNCG